MGKRGPKPSKGGPRKGTSLGARVTVETKRRLNAAAEANGVSLSEELEARLGAALGDATEDQLMLILRQAMRRAESMTGASWVSDAYTFELALATLFSVLRAFRPTGTPEPPPTMLPFKVEGDGPIAEELRRRARELIEQNPISTFANTIAQSVLVDIRNRGDAFWLSPSQRRLFKHASNFLDGLMTEGPDERRNPLWGEVKGDDK